MPWIHTTFNPNLVFKLEWALNLLSYFLLWNRIGQILRLCMYNKWAQYYFFLFLLPDAISENQPRVIDDSRARKLAVDLKRCAYYETCATYGLNVERVFQDSKFLFLKKVLVSLVWLKIISVLRGRLKKKLKFSVTEKLYTLGNMHSLLLSNRQH